MRDREIRVSGKGYEHRFVIVRKRSKAAFFFLLLPFSLAVYLSASAFFHFLFDSTVPTVLVWTL